MHLKPNPSILCTPKNNACPGIGSPPEDRHGERVSASEIGALTALDSAYFQRGYTILFYSLLLTIAAGPLFASMGFDTNLIELFLAANPVAAVIPISNHSGRR